MRNDSNPILTSPPTTITLYEPGGYARIEGDLWPLRHVIASYWQQCMIGAGGEVVPELTHRQYFDRCMLTGRTHCVVALVRPIISTLRSAGIEPVIKQVGELPLNYSASPSVIARLHAPWDSFASAVDSNADGVIEIPGTRALVEGLITFCRLYPDKSILILSASQSACRWLRWRLQVAIGEPVELGIKSREKQGRIVVGTYRRPLNPRDFDMVIVAFGHELAGEKVYEALLYIFGEVRRRYAFVHNYPLLDAIERGTARALFGGTIWATKNQATTPVQVYHCDAFSPAPALESRELGLQRKRSLIWQNAARNQAIARAAMAMIDRDITQLWEQGLLLDHAQFPAIAVAADWRVAILVENTEHAAELKKLVPSWPIIRAGSDWMTGDGVDSGAGMIVTLTRAVEAGVDCSALLWAAGGVARPVAGFPRPGASMGIVVDFAVSADGRDELRRRVRTYHTMDWDIDERFLRAADGLQTIQSRVDGAGDDESHPNQQRHVDARSTSGRSQASRNKSRRKRVAAKHKIQTATHNHAGNSRKENRHKHKRTGNHSGTSAHLHSVKRI